MIGYLKGRRISQLGDKLLIEVSGVGYVVNWGFVSEQDEQMELFVRTLYRENDVSLWGFAHQDQLQVFDDLLGVNGVGAKTAYSLVVNLGISQIASAVESGEYKTLRISGVGEKTAQKIVLECRGKFASFADSTVSGSGVSAAESQLRIDVQEALQSLGVSSAEAKVKSKQIEYREDEDLAAHLRRAIAI